MFNKMSLFQGFKDCSQRGIDQSTGDALAHPITLELCSNSSDTLLITSSQNHSILGNAKTY